MKKLLLILLFLPIIGLGQCTVTSNDESSPGACDGSISVTVTGCTAPYFYTWSNGTNNPFTTGLCTGIYTIIVTDANGNICCNLTVPINVTAGIAGCTDSLALNYDPTATVDDSSCVYCNLTATISTTDISCNGGSDGSVIITSNGGCAPYTYLWNNGFTSQGLSGIPAGTYTYTVTDCNGCSVTDSVTITEPSVLTATISTTDVSCNGMCDGTATSISTGGCAPYSYNWSDGQTTATAIGLCAGTYTCTVTDCNGCFIANTFMITEPLPLTSYDTLSSTTSINWNGMVLNVSGDYSATLINAAGCDSIANLNLAITIPSGILNVTNTEKFLVKITDVLGKETPYRRNIPLFYIYDDGTVEKRIVIE